MSLDVHKAVLTDVKTALAAITPQATPPISPIPESRVYYNRRPSDAPIPHAWLRGGGTTPGPRPAMRAEYDTFLLFDAWARNRDEADAIRKAVQGVVDGAKKPASGTAKAITIELNNYDIITEGPPEVPTESQHLWMVFGARYLETAVITSS